jgi:Na+-driven multidrug efflux pump
MVMTLTSGVGIMAVFFIDLLSMFYVSLAHRDEWRAAVSLMSKVMFFPFALNLGMIVGIGTVVSVAIGRGDLPVARRSASMGLVLIGGLGLLISLAALPWRMEILRLFGAHGDALDIAARLLAYTLPVNVLLSVGMGCASILRACGDARRAMFVTLAGAVATSIADPIFIFGLHQGVDGVGSAIVVSRIVFVAVGMWAALFIHRMVAVPRLATSRSDLEPLLAIAIPAIATNLALPFADWYVTRTIWQFGVGASAAAGIYDRIMPVVFGFILALASAISPIVGQNLGANLPDRVRLVFRHSLALTAGYGVVIWVLVSVGAPYLAQAFHLDGDAGVFFMFLCRYATITWIFVGFLLVANAMFNTLGQPRVATMFNWGRATLGTIPFVWLGAKVGGAQVAMLGIALAAVLFAGVAVLTANGLVRQRGRERTPTLVPILESSTAAN